MVKNINNNNKIEVLGKRKNCLILPSKDLIVRKTNKKSIIAIALFLIDLLVLARILVRRRGQIGWENALKNIKIKAKRKRWI